MTWCGGVTAGRRIARLVEAAGLEIIPHRGGSLWGLPIALTSPSCTMAESFPAGSAILDAMKPQAENGDFLAPDAPGFGTQLTEELDLKDSRWARVPARRRPYYGPVQRMRILELRSARGWSTQQTAERFLVREETIASWMRRLPARLHAPRARLLRHLVQPTSAPHGH